jgi:YgiT-type zinc finger domain-containing protein
VKKSTPAAKSSIVAANVISSSHSAKQNNRVDIETWVCPTCGKGQMRPHVITKELRNPDGTVTRIPGIAVDICDLCGEHAYGVEALRKIEAHKKSIANLTLHLPFLVYRNLEIQAYQHGHAVEDEISSVLIADYNRRNSSPVRSK